MNNKAYRESCCIEEADMDLLVRLASFLGGGGQLGVNELCGQRLGVRFDYCRLGILSVTIPRCPL